MPSAHPTTSDPTKRPSHNPTTAEPTRKPSPHPTTADPTKRPSHNPTTDEPTRRPTSGTYLTPEPTKKPTEDQSGWGEPQPTVRVNNEEILAVDVNGVTETSFTGYSMQTEIA